jgi:hypothetical protein
VNEKKNVAQRQWWGKIRAPVTGRQDFACGPYKNRTETQNFFFSPSVAQ